MKTKLLLISGLLCASAAAFSLTANTSYTVILKNNLLKVKGLVNAAYITNINSNMCANEISNKYRALASDAPLNFRYVLKTSQVTKEGNQLFSVRIGHRFYGTPACVLYVSLSNGVVNAENHAGATYRCILALSANNTFTIIIKPGLAPKK
jgi:hypothetical protein